MPHQPSPPPPPPPPPPRSSLPSSETGIEVSLETSEGWFNSWWGDDQCLDDVPGTASSDSPCTSKSVIAAEIALGSDSTIKRRKLTAGITLAAIAVLGIAVAAVGLSKNAKLAARSSDDVQSYDENTRPEPLSSSTNIMPRTGTSDDVGDGLFDTAPESAPLKFNEETLFEDSASADELSAPLPPLAMADATTSTNTPTSTGSSTPTTRPSTGTYPKNRPTESTTASTQAYTDDPPNILFLYSDQHQAAATGYEGHPDVLTPNLDKLATEGTYFSRAYINNGICASSRESMMAGLHPRTLGILDNPDQSRTKVSEQVHTLASTFRDRGYATAAIGKRHLSYEEDGQLDAGWDVRKSHRYRTDTQNTYIQWLIEQGTNSGTGVPYIQEFAEDSAACDGKGPRGGELSDLGNFGRSYVPEVVKADLCTRKSRLPANYTMEAWTAMETIKYIKNRDRTKPFMLWSTFYRPHQPYNPLQKYLDMYAKEGGQDWSKQWGEGLRSGSSIKKPANLEQDPSSLPPVLADVRQREAPIWNCGTAAKDHQIYRDYMAGYYALITEVDHYVGDILKVLEEEGLMDNTIVVYTSDHGEFAGRHGLVAKQSGGHTLYEEVYRVPLIFRWPGHIQANRMESGLTEAVDLYPTLLELAGIDNKPADGYPLQGKSLVPTLKDAEPTRTEYIIAENWYAITIFTEQYKLSRWFTGTDLRQEYQKRDWSSFGNLLFDRRYDPNESEAFPLETENLYYNEDYIEVRNELERKIDEWIMSTSSAGRDEWMATSSFSS